MFVQNRIRGFAVAFGTFFTLVAPQFSAPVWGQSADPFDWSYLSTSTIGAKQFIEKHPDFDGRGCTIFILDSGVDMGVAGLTKTSTGLVKVMDVQDFSGQGDVTLYPGEPGAEGQEYYIQHPSGLRLYNYQRLSIKPIENEFLIGYLDEHNFQNSEVRDINNNGQFDDTFGVLVFESETADSLIWIAFVDTDGDGHVDDEKPIRDYHVQFDSFQLRGGDKKYHYRPMNFAINILPDEMKVSFHFDDDGHGTHVSGIAAGFEINGEKGFNGIAPGAQIVSLKIGNGTFKGGCTVSGSIKKAIDFVERYTRDHKSPAIVNISYGIGSVREGQSQIDELIDNLLAYNDSIFVSVSAGNEGPGISTVGTPAASNLAFTVGALLNRTSAHDLYGAELSRDMIFYFSARGGELNKPDAVAPGLASSTVPRFSQSDVMRGTSMAAPQVAGAAAILWSAASQSQPKLLIHNFLLKRALKNTALALDDYGFLDQGAGLIQMNQAFQWLNYYSNDHRDEAIVTYSVTTESPGLMDGEGETAFWRAAGYFPADRDLQKFMIRPRFNLEVDADSSADFFRSFHLKSSHPWLSATKNSIYLKGENAAEVEVRYDQKQLTKPGLYCGKIYGFRNQQPGQSAKQCAEFELLNTVIVPFIFDQGNRYQHKFFEQKLPAGQVERYFILVPTGATSASIAVSPARSAFCDVECFAFKPDGSQYVHIGAISSAEENEEIRQIPQDALTPGIWEIAIYADFMNRETSTYNLEIAFCGFMVEPTLISNFHFEVGQEPNGYFKVTNLFNVPFHGFSRGKISGFQRNQENITRVSDIFTYDFSIEAGANSAEFFIRIDEASFLQMTDVAVNIYNSRGTAVYKEAFHENEIKISLSTLYDDSYTLEMVPAFTDPYKNTQWTFTLLERYLLKDTITIKIYQDNERIFKLYPLIQKECEFTLEKSPRIAPEGFVIFGEIEFIDRNLLRQIFTVPIEFKLH